MSDSFSISDLSATQAQTLAANNSKPVERDLSKLDDKKLKQAAQQFEGMFMDLVMKSMRQAGFGDSGDFIGDSEHVKLYQGMLDTEYASSIGKTGKLGIADALYRQFAQKGIDQSEGLKK